MSPTARGSIIVVLLFLACSAYAVLLHLIGMNRTHSGFLALSTALVLCLAYAAGRCKAREKPRDPSLENQLKDWTRDKTIFVHPGHKTTTCGKMVFLGTGFPLGSPERAPDILLEGYWPDASLEEKKEIILRLWQDPGAMFSILKSLQEKYPTSQEPSEKPVSDSEAKYRIACSTEEWLNDFSLFIPLNLVRAIEEWVRNHPSEGEALLDAVRTFLHPPDDAFFPYWGKLTYSDKSSIWDEWLDDPDKIDNILIRLKNDTYPL